MTVVADRLTVHYTQGLLRRRRLTALDAIDLEVREGDFFALLGSNGAGKTTALHCFLGLLRPSSGTVRVLGECPKPGAPLFARVGYLPEEPRYHEYLSVQEALTYYARLSGVGQPAARIAMLLDRLGLAEHRTLSVRRCSKGMKQKLGIIQAVVHEPRLLFLDEPMRGLDPAAVHVFRDMLLEMHRDGVTIVMSSHLLGEVEMVANRVAIVERGRVVVQDNLAALLRKNADRYAVAFEAGSVDLPPFLQQVTRDNGSTRALIGCADLYPFMEFTRANELRVLSCAIEKQTLEESFMAIVRDRVPHA